MKTFSIELRNVKAMTNGNGLIRAKVDVQVAPQAARDEDGESFSTLQMTEQTARVLFLLLKNQFAEFDARQPRSRRSGRS